MLKTDIALKLGVSMMAFAVLGSTGSSVANATTTTHATVPTTEQTVSNVQSGKQDASSVDLHVADKYVSVHNNQYVFTAPTDGSLTMLQFLDL